MKKTILTLSLVALFSIVSKAQDSKSKTDNTKNVEPAQTAVNADGTISTATVNPNTPAAKEETPAKKSGTRMAINEKGLPGSSKTAKKEPAKEEKTSPALGQPGSSSKKQ